MDSELSVWCQVLYSSIGQVGVIETRVQHVLGSTFQECAMVAALCLEPGEEIKDLVRVGTYEQYCQSEGLGSQSTYALGIVDVEEEISLVMRGEG